MVMLPELMQTTSAKWKTTMQGDRGRRARRPVEGPRTRHRQGGPGDTPRVLFPLTEAINRLALSAPAVWVVGIAGSPDQKAGL